MKKYISIIIVFLISSNVSAQNQISNLVVPVNYFIDHVAQLEKVKNNLANYKQASVVGVSGMGKTQVARMYAYEHKTDYDLIWFIDCNLDIDQQLVKLAKAINTQENASVVSDNINIVRKELMSYLTSKGNWLLVFDNLKVGENKKVQDFINWEHNGNIIFGSQDSELLSHIVKVSAFAETESKLLVRNILENNSPGSVEFLAKEFGGYPILMVQGAQILNQVQGLDLNEYKKKIRSSSDKIELNIRLAINELSPTAKNLLNEIALINNQSFSRELLNSITSNKDSLDDDIYNLSKFALITNIEPNEVTNPTFEMHDVIVDKISQINGNKDNKENLNQLITNLFNTIPKSLIKGNVFRNSKTVLDNIEIITKNAENYDVSIYKILELKFNLLIQYVTACDLTKSKILVNWFDKNEKENNFKLLMMSNDEKGAYASYLGRIGWYYLKNSEGREAIEYFMKAKKVFEGVKGYETLKSNIVFGLVISNVQLGNLEEAEANLRIMQDMFNQSLIDKTDAATLDYAKAYLFLAQGKYDEALKQINATIDACISNGMKPQDVFLTGLYLLKIDILNNLKNYSDALPLLEEVYNMKKPKEKQEYPIFGRIYTQMSVIKLGLGNINEASEYARKAIEAFLKDPNRSNKNVAASPDIYLAKAFVAEGNALASLNKNEEAVTAYATAENIYWNNYRENMKNVDAISIMYLNAVKASCHVSQKSFYKNFRNHHIEKFGDKHPRSIEILNLKCHTH